MTTLSGLVPVRATQPTSTDWAARQLYPDVTSADRVQGLAAVAGGTTAVVDGGTGVRLTWLELATAVDHLAGALSARGVGLGDVVTAQLPNWWEAAVVFHATARLGAVLNPIVPIYREREVGFILGQARPKVVITPHRFRGFDHVTMVELAAGAAEPLVVVVRPDDDLGPGRLRFDDLLAERRTSSCAGSAGDIALLLYTSGTTADPKGVLHSHQTLGYEVQSFVELFALTAADGVFTPSPVTHITGLLFGLLLPSVTGCAVTLLDVWEPAVAVDLVEQESCRFVMGATPFLHGMRAEHVRRGHPSALRYFLCGGADVPPALVRQASEALGCLVARVYGSSEFPTLCCGGPREDMRVRADTDGLPVGPVRYRLEDERDGTGELLVDGPERFLGYLDEQLNDAAFTPDGMFRTGDLASIDAAGAVTIRGRSKDIVLRGGENISVKEVEDLLHQHPGVAQVAVVAMPDPVLVERCCAFVVPAAGAPPSLTDLRAHLSERRLATQKFPERLELVAALPTTASGKVQKHLLRQQVRDLLAHETTPPTDDPGAEPR